MTSKPPPVPPANRSKKGTGDDGSSSRDAATERDESQKHDHRGEQANVKQNTRNQGYQQDR